MSTLLPVETPERTDQNNDNPDLAHYVDQRGHPGLVDDAYLNQTEITALCGVKFVPTKPVPGRKVCELCIEIMYSST